MEDMGGKGIRDEAIIHVSRGIQVGRGAACNGGEGLRG
jgi:hypothetical protein